MSGSNENDDDIWRAETPEQPPCGPNLDYDPDFLALEAAARGSPEQQFGETIVPAEPPDWRAVASCAVALLKRSRDLRAFVLWTRALTQLEGLTGTVKGLQAIVVVLKAHWPHVHPVPEEDGDVFMRMNALAALADPGGLLLELRNQAFLEKRNLRLTLREAEQLIKSTVPHLDNGLSREQFLSAIADDVRQAGEQTQAVALCRQTLIELRATLLDRIAPSQLPDLQELEGLFATLASVIANHAPSVSATNGAAAPAGHAIGPPAAHGEIQTRSDATQALDRVCIWLETNEPSNPASLLIRRAQRLMNMGFLDVIREFAPDSIGHFETITTGRLSG